MTWAEAAQALLDAASAATLSEAPARTFLAPSGGFARDCRLLAVYVESIDAAPLPTGELPGQGCAVIPSLNLRVVFAADCAPVPNDQGTPPPPDDVTAWTTTFLDDSGAVWEAVAAAAFDGALGECDSVNVEQARTTGPLGGMATTIIPVRLLLL